MTREDIIELVDNGKIFGAEFTKRDGTLRKMSARIGVTSHLRGGQLPYNPVEKQLLTVFDMGKSDYRSIPLNRLHALHVGGKTIHF